MDTVYCIPFVYTIIECRTVVRLDGYFVTMLVLRCRMSAWPWRARGLAYFEQVDGKLVERTGDSNPFMNASSSAEQSLNVRSGRHRSS